jgi:hypothetical protein
MVTQSQASPVTDLLQALSANNPFDKPPVVRAQNIWGESFPDVTNLNAHASNAALEALEKVRTAEDSLGKITSLVFTAERGVGKSHVIKRIRKHLQANDGTFFIYASVDKYGDLDFVNTSFQQSLAESLDQIGNQEVSQWQEIAALVVADALRTNNPKATIPSAVDLSKKFDLAYKNSHSKGKDLVSDLAKTIQKLRPKVDLYILRAIIWTLSEERGALAVKWLSGEQLEAQDAIDMRLPLNDKCDKAKEATALTTIVDILTVIADYGSVLVCFDELDTIATAENQGGFTAPFVIADLVKRLFDSASCNESSKGIAFLMVLLPNTWRNLNETKEASAAKVSAYGKPIDLQYLNSESLLELVTIWLSNFYQKRNLVSPTPIYPFEQSELLDYAKGRPFVREALQWLANTLPKKVEAIEPQKPLAPKEKFEKAYQDALNQFGTEHLDDTELIASALEFSFKKIIALDKGRETIIQGVALSSIEEITPRNKNAGHLNFKVVGKENGQSVSIGVSVLQQTHGLAVGAAFKRLLDFETFGMTRSCLVRSSQRKLKRNWDSFRYYQQLVAKGGEWVDLKVSEIKPLLALKYVYDHRDSFDLSERRLDSFAFTRNLLVHSPLIGEILSKPEGQMHEESLEGQEIQHLHTEEELQEIVASLGSALEIMDSKEMDEQMDLSVLEVA